MLEIETALATGWLTGLAGAIGLWRAPAGVRLAVGIGALTAALAAPVIYRGVSGLPYAGPGLTGALAAIIMFVVSSLALTRADPVALRSMAACGVGPLAAWGLVVLRRLAWPVIAAAAASSIVSAELVL